MFERTNESGNGPHQVVEAPVWTERAGVPVRIGPVQRVVPVSASSGACYQEDAVEAAVAFRIQEFAVSSVENGEALSLLSGRIVDWLSSQDLSTSVQIRLLADPEREMVAFSLWIAQEHSRRERAISRAVEGYRELSRLFRGCPVVRVNTDPGAVLETMIPVRPRHGIELLPPRVELTVPGTAAVTVVAHLEPSKGAPLDETVRLLLEQVAPAGVLLSMSRARSVELIHAALDAASAQAAALTKHLGGRSVAHNTDTHAGVFVTTETHKPDDVLPGMVANNLLLAHAGHLHQLSIQAFEARMVVLGRSRPSDTLVNAVHREWLGGGRRPLRLDLGAEEAFEAISRLSPAYPPIQFDDGVPVQLARMMTRDQAWGLLRMPTPGVAGLPGIPANYVVPRHLPPQLAGDQPGYRLGVATTRVGSRPYRIAPADLLHHLYLSGKTGVGKSTLLLGLMLDAAHQGAGLGLIDPHGDLAAAFLERLPKHRRQDVILFDPTREPVPCLDPLDNDGTRLQQDLVKEEIISIFFKLFQLETMGPMFEQYAKALLVPLLRAGKRFTDVRRLRFDQEFRAECLAALDPSSPLDADVLQFWFKEQPGWGEQHTAEMDTYVLSKFVRLTSSELSHRVMGSHGPVLSFSKLLDRNRILIASLPAGQIGQLTSYFLGMVLISKLQQAVFARSGQPAAQRRPFFLFLDEFHNFVGSGGFSYSKTERSLSKLLSEARKFGMGLVLAHQFAAQLDDATRHAIMGNVGAHLVFRSGAPDAEFLEDLFNGHVSKAEIQALPLYLAFASVMHDGLPLPAFTLRTIAPSDL